MCWDTKPVITQGGRLGNKPQSRYKALLGVALTGRGRIAVYVADCNERWPARLDDYDGLDQAARDVPADIVAWAAAELGEERIVWRDI